MTRLLTLAAFGLAFFASPIAFAGEKTVTLTVQNMFCAACPSIVRRSLEAVPGVTKVSVSYQDKTAVVTFDDAKADIKTLTAATTNAGYPATPRS